MQAWVIHVGENMVVLILKPAETWLEEEVMKKQTHQLI
jgi:hypothetical protein